MFNIPSKTTLKEMKMTFLLVSLVASHITLTIPVNVTLFYWTYFPKVWVSSRMKYEQINISRGERAGMTYHVSAIFFIFQEQMHDQTRVIVSSLADTLRVVNYSINFYLYCVANDDIRKAAVSIIRDNFIFQRLKQISRYLWNAIVTN